MTLGQRFALTLLLNAVVIAGIVALFIKTDIGQAIADAIRHNSGANKGAAARRELEEIRSDMEQVRLELDQLHLELNETHERLDFAERLLAKGHEVRVDGRLQ